MTVAFDGRHTTCPVGETMAFSGYADDFDFGVGAIEFSLDDGVTWTSYPCEGSRDDVGVTWRFAYTPKLPGRYVLKARAVGKNGVANPLVSSFAFAALPARGAAGRVFGSFQLRALDGGPIEGARLFRSAELAGMSAEEGRVLAEALGVRTVYDLRSSAEVAARPEPVLAGVRCVAVAPHETHRRKDASKRLVAGVIGQYGAPEERMRANYRRYVSEYPTMSAALRGIAAEGVPALVHCVNGKDRTGVLAAVVERIAGHPREQIVANYLATNELCAAQIAADEARLGAGMTAGEHAILMSFLEARPSYLQAFFDEAEAQFGGWEGYLSRGLRLTPAHLATLRALMTR